MSFGPVRTFARAGGDVTLATRWRRPPWCNTEILFQDRSGPVRVAVSAFDRQRVRRALQMAGLRS